MLALDPWADDAYQPADILDDYRAALAEIDARPARFQPSAEITAQGKALLQTPFVEMANAAHQERIHKEKAKADRLKAQQRHPLYNTVHQQTLLEKWEADDIAPFVPEKSLQNFTAWIIRHADADNEQVRELAKELDELNLRDKGIANIAIPSRLGTYSKNFYHPDESKRTPINQKNLRRAIRTAIRRFNEQAAHILSIVGAAVQKYVSDKTLWNRKSQLELQAQWLEDTTVISDDSPDMEPIPLSECIRTAKHRFNELYTLVSGQERRFTGQGFIALFVTLTAPARFHPNPAQGNNQWDGSTVTESHEWFMTDWVRTRALFSKHGIPLEGFRVTEPHKDGAEHWHVLLYIKEQDIEDVKALINRHFAHSPHAVKYKHDFAKPADKKEKKEKGHATAAGYMLKYLIKSLSAGKDTGTSADNDEIFNKEAAAADAWRATWGIRAFQFFGVLHGKLTLWRELRRLEICPEEEDAARLWRAAKGGRGQLFISIIAENRPELATIREVKETWTEPDPDTAEIQKVTIAGRVLGVSVNGVEYITHTKKWTITKKERPLATVSPCGAQVTVIHKSPRADPTTPQTPDETDAPLPGNVIFSPGPMGPWPIKRETEGYSRTVARSNKSSCTCVAA